MDKTTAESLAKKIQISKDYIVREEYEMLILKEIYESEFATSLMFKGGTALRLAYGSARFSEDLDFNLINEIDKMKFIGFIKGLGKKYPGMVEITANEKHYTVFALIKIKVEYLDRAFSIKIEISKRAVPPAGLSVDKTDKAGGDVKDRDYSDKIIKSEAAPLTVLVR